MTCFPRQSCSCNCVASWTISVWFTPYSAAAVSRSRMIRLEPGYQFTDVHCRSSFCTDSRLYWRPVSWSQGFSDAGLLQYHTVRCDFLHEIRGSGDVLARFHIGDVSTRKFYPGAQLRLYTKYFCQTGDAAVDGAVGMADVLSCGRPGSAGIPCSSMRSS